MVRATIDGLRALCACFAAARRRRLSADVGRVDGTGRGEDAHAVGDVPDPERSGVVAFAAGADAKLPVDQSLATGSANDCLPADGCLRCLPNLPTSDPFVTAKDARLNNYIRSGTIR
jgi:hypothetical protein